MLILGSQSPRRKEILTDLGLSFEVIPSDFEEIIDQGLTPQQVVLDLSYGKGRDLIHKHENDVIICADTIVYFDGKKLGKAKNREEARQLMLDLFDHSCEVITGNAIFSKDMVISKVTVSKVVFSKISETELDFYLDRPDADWQDKAGSFAIQGHAREFAQLEGEYSSTLGLSESFLRKYLPEFEVEIPN
jgi:septum formation protein